MRRIFAVPALGFALAFLAAPVGAVDETKPSPTCGSQFSERSGDAEPPNLDLTGGFFKHDPAQGEEATTVNIEVANLDKTVPEGSTFVVWQMDYVNPPEETVRFARALTDFSGLVFYEYGEQAALGVTTLNRPTGSTTGAFFEGEAGIVQVVIPPEHGGAAGTTFDGYGLITFAGAPGVAAAQTPTRGPLTEVDAVAGRGTWTAGPCTAPPTTADPQPAPGPAPEPAADDRALPVELVSRRAKRSRRAKVRLRSSEPVTQLAAQLVRKRKVAARGKLRELDGTRSLRLKARRKLRKGSYRLDLAGTTADGVRRFASFKLRVR